MVRQVSIVTLGALALASCDAPPSAPAAAASETPTPGPITLEQFSKVRQGMTMAEVKAALQRDGTQQSAQDIDGATVQVYSFDEPSGNAALIFFADGKVIKANPPLDMKGPEL